MSQIFAFSCARNQADWLKAAITESGLKSAEFLRAAAFRLASATTGDDAPDKTRATDLISEAASKQGLDRKQFVRYATLVAAGLDADVALARATVVRRKREAKAKAAE